MAAFNMYRSQRRIKAVNAMAFSKLKKQSFGTDYSELRSIHVIDRHFELGYCKNIYRAPFRLVHYDLKN